MSQAYRDCSWSTGGRFEPITRLVIPMALVRGLGTNPREQLLTLERLFAEAFGIKPGNFTDANTQGLLGGMHANNKVAQVELPEGIENGLDRLRSFVDSLYLTQLRVQGHTL